MDEIAKHSITKRLVLLQSQLRGLQKMVDDDRDSIDVLTLLAAIRAALEAVGTMILTEQVAETLMLGEGASEQAREQAAQVRIALQRFIG
jgi:DNA-binding FrmR family transcriptional regulator